MKRVSAKLMPKLLIADQMEHRIEVCLEMKTLVFCILSIRNIYVVCIYYIQSVLYIRGR